MIKPLSFINPDDSENSVGVLAFDTGLYIPVSNASTPIFKYRQLI